MRTEAKESLADRTRRLWDRDVHSTARRLLAELQDELDGEELIEALLPWVADRVRATMRLDVRNAERAAWEDPGGRPGPQAAQSRVARSFRLQAGPMPELDNLEFLLQLPVLVPVAGSATQVVAWRDMTVADHQARIGMLRKPLAAVHSTIRKHEWSIQEIVKYQVRSLGDIDVALLREDMQQEHAS